MNALALSLFIADPRFEKFLSGERYLKAGNRLRGRVRDIRSNGKLLMDFGNFRALARVNFPVDLDEALDVVVLENRDQLRLGLIHPKNSNSAVINRGVSPFEVSLPAASKHFQADIEKVIARHTTFLKPAGLPKKFLSTMSKISAHFSPLKLDGTILEVMGQLKSRTLNSGLFFEKRLEHALTNLQWNEKGASFKHLLRLPAIREILANDLKPVLWPLRLSLNPASYRANFSGTKTTGPIRNMVESLVHQINNRQKCAVGRGLTAGPVKSPSVGRPNAGKVHKETIPHLIGLISRLMHKLESYEKTSGGISEKEIQQAFVKTSGSAKALLLKLRPDFDEHGTNTGKSPLLRSTVLRESFEAKEPLAKGIGPAPNNAPGNLEFRPEVQQNRPFNPISHLSKRSGEPAETVVEEPVRSEPASRTGQARQSIHWSHPTAFKPELQADLARHLAEVIARMKAGPDPSAAPAETIADEPVDSKTASSAGQTRQPIELPPPGAPRQNLQTNLLLYLLGQSVDKKIDPDLSGVPPGRMIEQWSVDQQSSAHTVQPKEPVEFVEINRVISRDLMPGLLTLDRYLNTRDNVPNPDVIERRDGLHRTVKELLTVIRHFQGQSRAGSEPVPEQAQVFSYDFFIKENEQRAKLKIYYPRKKKDKQKQVFKASLFLSMDRIGDIRTDFSLWEKSMNITFHVGDQEVKNTIEKNMNQITPNLKKTVETLTIKVKVTEKAVEQVETVWTEFSGDNIIDVRI